MTLNVLVGGGYHLLSKDYIGLLTQAGNLVGVKVFELKKKKLEEVCVYTDGTHKTPKYISSGVPFISVENIKCIYDSNKYISNEDYKLYKYKPKKGDLFMTRIGDIGTCSIVEDERDLAYYVTLALIRADKTILNSKFLRYYIESSYGKRELNKRILHTANPIKINLGDIGKIKISIPPLPIQEYIVSILDKFEALSQSTTEGLRREIELREKQYEYYREKLLTFEK